MTRRTAGLGICCLSSWSATSNSWRLACTGRRARTLLPKTCHTYSMGERSGEFAGHWIVTMPCCLTKSTTNQDVWVGHYHLGRQRFDQFYVPMGQQQGTRFHRYVHSGFQEQEQVIFSHRKKHHPRPWCSPPKEIMLQDSGVFVSLTTPTPYMSTPICESQTEHRLIRKDHMTPPKYWPTLMLLAQP